MEINYYIQFYSDWHCGSGLSSGADMDLLVVKDQNELPYVPGKTVKGLLREALMNYCEFKKIKLNIDELMGKEGELTSTLFFSNAELCEEERYIIVATRSSSQLYRGIASTAINNDGIAKNGSLRKMQVTIPCCLEGTICNVPEEHAEHFEKAMKLVKRIGQGRTRGLGRCDMRAIHETKGGTR